MAQATGIADRYLIRRINRAVILRLVRELAPVSRTDLTAAAALSPASVSGITADLLREGLIVERETGRSTGGRRPIMLTINPDAGLAIGIKLTEQGALAVVTDFQGNVVDSDRTTFPDQTPETVTATLAALVGAVRARHGDRQMFGIGVGLAGAIDRETGHCHFSPFLRWRDVPLREMLEAQTGLPVVIENDVATLTIAERWFGAGAGERDFLVVTLGRGVGLGMTIDGKPYRGARGQGGEFGHTTVDPDGPVCDCGKRGCLEAIAGEAAIGRAASRVLGTSATATDAAERAWAGNREMQAVFRAAGSALGMALANLVNLFDPTLIILSGEGTRLLDLLEPSLRTAMTQHCFGGLAPHFRLTVDPWGDEAWARGAASLLLEETLTPRPGRIQPGVRGRLERELVSNGSTGAVASLW